MKMISRRITATAWLVLAVILLSGVSSCNPGGTDIEDDPSLSWHIETVEIVTAGSTSICLDADGSPCIGYYDYSNGDLKCARLTGSGWEIDTVDSLGVVGNHVSIVLDASGAVHITYYDETNGDLKYAWKNLDTYEVETVDSEGYVGGFTSIALDAGGNVHVSYFDGTNSDLKYAYRDGHHWSTGTVDGTGYTGRLHSSEAG